MNRQKKFTDNEKSIFITAYFLGTVARDIALGMEENKANHGGMRAISLMLNEFGLEYVNKALIDKFTKEMNELSIIINKEYKIVNYLKDST